MIGGDFNVDSHGLQVFDLWRQMGWISAQDLAFQLCGQEPTYTCKHSTATGRDLIWLSPEAAALCRWADVADIFAEHSTMTVGLEISHRLPAVLTWPRPSKIPGTSVDPAWSGTVVPPAWLESDDVDAKWAQWASSFERSLSGFVHGQPQCHLQTQQCGRLQRTQPMRQKPPLRIKPSRPSEVVLRNDLTGNEVKFWFRQLRRLQSLVLPVPKRAKLMAMPFPTAWSCGLPSDDHLGFNMDFPMGGNIMGTLPRLGSSSPSYCTSQCSNGGCHFCLFQSLFRAVGILAFASEKQVVASQV
eukprot:s675_g31.t1